MISHDFLTQEAFLKTYKKLIYVFGLETSIFLSELLDKEAYFKGKYDSNKIGQWFYRSIEKIEIETTLSKYQQTKSIKILENFFILETKKEGIPYKRYYKINHQNLSELLTTLPNLQVVKNLTTSCQKFDNLFVKIRQQSVKNFTTLIYNIKNIYKDHNINNSPIEDIEQNNSIESKEIQSKKTKKQLSNLKKYKNLSSNLASIIQSKRKINKNSNISSWIKPIQDLVEKDLNINDTKIKDRVKRVQKALDWYSDHIGEKYVPVIQSGESLRSKFDKLENAMDRDKSDNESYEAASANDHIYRKMAENAIID